MRENKTEGKSALAPLWGVITAYAATAIVFVVYALLLTYTQISEKNTGLIVLATLSASLVLGGIKCAVSAGQKGLVLGMATGLLYVAVMIGAGFLFMPSYALGTKTLVCLMLAVCSGGLGGVIGVNVRGRR